MTEQELITALKQAYYLGQTYWQQADSDYESQHKKADVTQETYIELVKDTVAKFKSI
jgi:hypothetical protein